MSLSERINSQQPGAAVPPTAPTGQGVPTPMRQDAAATELRHRIHQQLIDELGPILFDRRLSLNGDVFVTRLEDAQFQAQLGGIANTANAPEVKSRGAELELQGRFGRLGFNLGVSYLDAYFSKATALIDNGVVVQLIKDGRKVVSYPFSGYWLDMGRPDDYARAIEEFESRRADFLPTEKN